jgi:hypothetical protein
MASGAFPGSFWRRLLKLVDAELKTEASMVIIGGAAIALEYANRHLTRDLDTSTAIEGALLEAVERAQKAIKARDRLEEPPLVGTAGVFDAPEGYEERCRPVRIAGLRQLRVFVPERHDLALMKAARGDERDLAALAAMHRRKPFRLKTLVSRYNEMQFTGSPEALRSRFLLLVARLFGESAAKRVETSLKVHM